MQKGYKLKAKPKIDGLNVERRAVATMRRMTTFKDVDKDLIQHGDTGDDAKGDEAAMIQIVQ